MQDLTAGKIELDSLQVPDNIKKYTLLFKSDRTATVYNKVMAHSIEAPEAQERLRLIQACFDTLVQQASDGIFISTPEGHYLDVNNAGCGMLGYTREEILARSIAD